MSTYARKALLITHISLSVGWLGAVAAFLVLGIAGVTSADADLVRAVYLAMNPLGQFLIVPLSIAALVTGIIQSLVTRWGLFDFYWVVVKLILTIGATLLLLLHQFTAVSEAARLAAEVAIGTPPEIGALGTKLLEDAALAVLVLTIVTAVSVLKPWGRTVYGQRRVDSVQPGHDRANLSAGLPAGLKMFAAVLGASVLALAIIRHVGGGGMSHHH